MSLLLLLLLLLLLSSSSSLIECTDKDVAVSCLLFFLPFAEETHSSNKHYMFDLLSLLLVGWVGGWWWCYRCCCHCCYFCFSLVVVVVVVAVVVVVVVVDGGVVHIFQFISLFRVASSAKSIVTATFAWPT